MSRSNPRISELQYLYLTISLLPSVLEVVDVVVVAVVAVVVAEQC